jgi:hypothetical protein
VIYTFETPALTMDMIARLNAYAYDTCRATRIPSGWGECGRTGHITHYLARVGVIDLYVNYDTLADIFVGHTWD